LKRHGKCVFCKNFDSLQKAIDAKADAEKEHGTAWHKFRKQCNSCGKIKQSSSFVSSKLKCEVCCAAIRKEQRKAKQVTRNSCPMCGKVLIQRRAETVGKPCKKCAKKSAKRLCVRCGNEIDSSSKKRKVCDSCKMKPKLRKVILKIVNPYLLLCEKCNHLFDSNKKRRRQCFNCSSNQSRLYWNICPRCDAKFASNNKHAKFCAKHRKRNIKAFGQKGWEKTRQQVIARDGTVCQYCLKQIDKRVSVDHMIPLVRSGNSIHHLDKSNLCVACLQCNGSKQDKTPLEFFIAKYHEHRISFD
jgi:hypothetical protein